MERSLVMDWYKDFMESTNSRMTKFLIWTYSRYGGDHLESFVGVSNENNENIFKKEELFINANDISNIKRGETFKLMFYDGSNGMFDKKIVEPEIEYAKISVVWKDAAFGKYYVPEIITGNTDNYGIHFHGDIYTSDKNNMRGEPQYYIARLDDIMNIYGILGIPWG